MSWARVIGQQRVKELLGSTLRRNRLAHAYVFSGPEGVGKDAVAIELAKVLNCEARGPEACDRCRSCLMFDALQHPNLHLVFALPVGKGEKLGDGPMAKLSEEDAAAVREQLALKAANPYHILSVPRASTIKINSIRELRKESALSSFAEGKRVFVIIDAENLNDEASNAILKTLEEPHEDTLLILTVPSVDLLLPTILSRCQHVRFSPLEEEEISRALQEREGVPKPKADVVAQLALGSYSRALRTLGTDVEDRRSAAVDLLRSALYRPRAELVGMIDGLAVDYEKEGLEELLVMLQTWLRDSMLLREGRPILAHADDRAALEKFSALHPQAEYARAFEAIERSVSLLYKNVYIPLIFLTLASDLRRHLLPPR
jgi:DNA polymerase-3 subunit delta'